MEKNYISFSELISDAHALGYPSNSPWYSLEPGLKSYLENNPIINRAFLAKSVGVSSALISRFMSNRVGLSSWVALSLCVFLHPYGFRFSNE